MTDLVYNIDMTNNNTNNDNKNKFLKGTKTMTNVAHDVRVIKHIDSAYDTYANFPTGARRTGLYAAYELRQR